MSDSLAVPPKVTAPPLRILVVDDSHDAADSLALLLRILGHEVSTAYDGTTAVRLGAEFRPDVVLLDLALPGMHGCEVARKLRGEVGLRDALLVAATGLGRDRDRSRCDEAGFQFFLLKPLDLTQLQRLLEVRARRVVGAETAPA